MILLALHVGMASAADLHIDCGVEVAAHGEADRTVVTFERCTWVEYDRRDAFEIFTSSEITAVASSTRLGEAALDERRGWDLALVTDMGVRPEECDNVVAHQLGGTSIDGDREWTDYFGTKTFIDRTLDGAHVDGSRIVVSRDLDGAIAKIRGRWPAFDDTTLVVDRTGGAIPVDVAGVIGVSDDQIFDVREIIREVETTSGHVDMAVRLWEVQYVVQGDTGDRVTARYIADGVRIDPFEELLR